MTDSHKAAAVGSLRRRQTERLAVALLLCSLATSSGADEPQGILPSWFETNRVQAHFENDISDDLAGLYQELHPAIRSMGARVLTRIFKTTEEGAWWPTAAGYTHEAIGKRDLGLDIARHAHESGLKVIAYYRIMCDDFVEKGHPEWLCRDLAGKLVLEPRTRHRKNPQDQKHVICFNSPARELVKTRLLELADRGVDGIYFDSWHMPEVCTCENCKAAFKLETGRLLNVNAKRGSEEYHLMSEFVARTIVRNFREWKRAVTAKHSGVIFAVGSSLYPCFESQMQITPDLLEISDTSKTEFNKPFGGPLRDQVADTGIESNRRPRPFTNESFDLPTYELQNALGWSFTRDSCDGRPPLMWIPFTRTEEEALYSTAAAVSYGCIASIHPWEILERRSNSIQIPATQIYKSSYALGDKVSPHLASMRPSRFALIHISQRARDARIANPRALWVEFFAPILGAFEAIKEEHIPIATINDLQLERDLPPETRLIILPHETECTDKQRSVLSRFKSAGGIVLRLDDDQDWHLKTGKPKLKHELIAKIETEFPTLPMRARAPRAVHAIFYQNPASQKSVVCFVNNFGWFRSERDVFAGERQKAAPPSCKHATLEIADPNQTVLRAFEAVTGKELTVRHEKGTAIVFVPEFSIMACVVMERTASGKASALR